MPDGPDVRRIREELRHAQEEASRFRDQADRLRDQASEAGSGAREATQRLREEVRQAAREARDEATRLRREARELERRLREAHREARTANAEAPRDEAGEDHPLPLESDGVRRVKIDQTAGSLTLRFAAEGETTGVTTSSPRGTPRLATERIGDELRIRIELKSGWIFRRKQGINATVRLAPGLEHIRANLGYGDIELRDIAAASMKLNAGAGKIVGYSTRGNIDAEVGAGRINLNVHRGLANCHTGTGDVTLDIAEVVPGPYRVDVGIGRVEVRLPEQSPVFVETSTGMGKTINRYDGVSEDLATSRLSANTGIGELLVRGRDAAGDAPSPASPPRARGNRPPAARRHEAEELRILQLLEQGRISSEEAAELIAALQGAAPPMADRDNGAGPAVADTPD